MPVDVTCVRQSLHPLLRTSQVSLSSNPDTDFRYSAIYGTIGVYKGRILAIKSVQKSCIDMTRSMKKELKWVKLKTKPVLELFDVCAFSPGISEIKNGERDRND